MSGHRCAVCNAWIYADQDPSSHIFNDSDLAALHGFLYIGHRRSFRHTLLGLVVAEEHLRYSSNDKVYVAAPVLVVYETANCAVPGDVRKYSPEIHVWIEQISFDAERFSIFEMIMNSCEFFEGLERVADLFDLPRFW